MDQFAKGFNLAQLPQQAKERMLANQLREAQLAQMPEEQKARRELLGAQTRGAEELARSRQIEQQKNLLDMKRMEEFRRMLQGGGRAPMQQPGADVQKLSTLPLPLQVPTQMAPAVDRQVAETTERQATVINPGNPNLYHMDELYMQRPDMRDQFNKNGLKMSQQVKQSPETGQVFREVTYPSGRTEIQAMDVGRSPEEIARAKEIGKSDIKVYERALESVDAAGGAMDNLDYIIDKINESPNFDQVLGPVTNWLATWTGSDEDKKLIGEVQSAVGNIVLDAAKSIKGSFTGRDMSLINSVKPGMKDFPQVFKGKLSAMRALAELVSQRNSKIASYIREGMSPDKAIKRAQKETDLGVIRKDVEMLINPDLEKDRMFDIRLKMKDINTAEEFRSYLQTLSPKERDYLRRTTLGGQ
jgi:hypothetical protein